MLDRDGSSSDQITPRPAVEVDPRLKELEDLVDNIPCILLHADVRLDADDNYRWSTWISNEKAARRLLPYDIPDNVSFAHHWFMQSPEQDRINRDTQSRLALMTGLTSYNQEFRTVLPNGETAWFSEDVQITCVSPKHWHVVGVCIDVTRRKIAEAETRELIANARCFLTYAIVERIDCGEFHWQFQMPYEELARHWLPIAIEPGQRFSDAWRAARFDEDWPRLNANSSTAMLTGQPGYSQEFRVHRADGGIIWIKQDVEIEPIGPNRWRLVGVCTDITEKKEMELDREKMLQAALNRADRDPLTGLLNHRAFHKRLYEEVDRAMRNGGTFGLAMIDMDNFKFFNDSYGHSAGDDVLRQVAEAMRAVCRDYDIMARFGGDEFALILPGVSGCEAASIADRLKASLASRGYSPPGYDAPIPLSLSIGTAIFPDDATGRQEMLDTADLRLYIDKSEGGLDEATVGIRTRLMQSVEGFAALKALVVEVDGKDRYTLRHSREVLGHCVQMAREMEMDARLEQVLQAAALLHDVGKIGLPGHILRKPGPLTQDELATVKRYPAVGAVLVGATKGLEYTADIIRHHHERWDGLGYPDGLKASEIPPLACIVSVADAFSAMTTNRPFRKARSEDAAMEILVDGAGTQWAPHYVEAFVRAREKMVKSTTSGIG